MGEVGHAGLYMGAARSRLNGSAVLESYLEVVLVGFEEVVGLKEALPVCPAPISPLDLLAQLGCADKLLLQSDRHAYLIEHSSVK